MDVGKMGKGDQLYGDEWVSRIVVLIICVYRCQIIMLYICNLHNFKMLKRKIEVRVGKLERRE